MRHRIQMLSADVIEFLCIAQFVCSSHPEDFHRVVTGTGMGLIHSGDLMDMVVLNAWERHILKRRCVLGYWRFRDDIAMVLRYRKAMRPVLNYMKRAAPFLRICVENASRTSI